MKGGVKMKKNKTLIWVLIVIAVIVALLLIWNFGFRTGNSIFTGYAVGDNITTCPYCGDISESGRVDAADVAGFSNNYGKCNRTINQGDLNGDGCVNSLDLAGFSTFYGKLCTSIATGVIDAFSSPTGADVYVDSSKKGTTSLVTGLLRIRDVVSGSHDVTFSRAGYANTTKLIYVSSGCQASVAYAYLQVPCTPNCAGKNCGTDGCGGSCGTCSGNSTCENGQCSSTCIPTTCSALGKNCGTWSDGCTGSLNCGTCSGNQTCSSGICSNQSQPSTGSIYAVSSPSSAAIYMDDNIYKGSTPKTITGLSAGIHSIRITYPCYYEYNASVNVIGGETVNVNANLIVKPSICRGTALSCNSLSSNGTSACLNQVGCYMNNVTCMGLSAACNTFNSSSTCANQLNCYWSC
jgi:hypothetical protein